MEKTKTIDTTLCVENSVSLFLDSNLELDSTYTATLSALQQTLEKNGMKVHTKSLDASANGVKSILVLCRDIDHATSLSKQFNLHEQHVYWLQENPQKLEQTTLGANHWLVDWSNDYLFLPILSLLVQNQDIDKAKQHTEQKLALFTQCMGELSVTISAQGKIIEINAALTALMGNASAKVIGQDLLSCLQIPSLSAITRMQDIMSDVKRTRAMTRLPPFPIQFDNTVMIVDGFMGYLHNHETVLILRKVANWQSQQWLEQLSVKNAPVTLLLINPDDFANFNQQHGTDIGDEVLDEIMQSMTGLLRTADFASKYSGAVFAAHLPETNKQQGQALATRMQEILEKKQFSTKKLRLAFSFGLANLSPDEQLGEQSPLELFRRANAALQAARGIGGGTLVEWQPQFDANITANLDRMSGKFSDAPQDDFTLITLQWDLIRLIGNTHSLKTFSEQVCHALSTGMQCDFAGLYLAKNDGFQNSSYSASTQDIHVKSLHEWVNTNIKVENLVFSLETPLMPNVTFCQAIVPLVTRDHCLGMILLRWPIKKKNNAAKFGEQLKQVTPNLAAAIDRIILLENEQRRRVVVDKDIINQHELLFESDTMRAVLQQVKLVAPTDASVLIIGDSGTGKEIIARQIHNQSMLIEKPFITVDCSTIVEHLIESELFGHRKGAFTGATSDQPGMIQQADGGTLFLDEVGELPLDIQSKLLRFVQEKTFVAVGDQRVRKVDVRLVLATNRDLLDEVAMGRFRSDLYYRINVFAINLPPLHERGDDALLLCRHFLAKFNQQYDKGIVDFTPEAINKLHRYLWPGNVRELRNAMMRAVILCEGQRVGTEHLDLKEHKENETSHEHVRSANPLAVSDQTISNMAPFSDIPTLLTRLIDIALMQARTFPVSAWVELQWLTVCLTKWTSFYQVALQLDQSESTLRRRFAKLKSLELNLPLLVDLESECHSLLAQLLDANTHINLWTTIENTLHEIVMQQTISQKHKAQLLNVTQPTLRKILQQVRI